MNTLKHLHQFWNLTLNTKLFLIINQLAFPHIQQCFFRPLCKPVDSGAVDKRREHSETSSEGIAQRTHNNNHMNISLDSDKELCINIGLGWWNILFDTILFAGSSNLLEIFFLVDSSHIS